MESVAGIKKLPANVDPMVTTFDVVVDEYLPTMNGFSAMLEGIEDELLSEDDEDASDNTDTVLDTLLHLMRELTALRRLAVPLREVVGILMRPTTARTGKERGLLRRGARPPQPGGGHGRHPARPSDGLGDLHLG